MKQTIKNLLFRIKVKPVIAGSIITAATSLTIALLSTGNLTLDLQATDLHPLVENVLHKQDMETLQEELNKRVKPSSLYDLSNKYFSKDASPAAVKDTIRKLITYADIYLADREHYTYRMFRLKKIMLNMPRRNINTRIEGDNPEAYKLIQQLLKGIESYKGPIDGDRLKTYFAVKEFQENINSYTPGYFNPDNYGIFGNATLTAIIQIYEKE